MNPDIAVGRAVQVRAGKRPPTMVVLARDEPPPPGVTDLGNAWRPNRWVCGWFVQNSWRTAVFPAECLKVVERPEDDPPAMEPKKPEDAGE